MLAFFLKPLRQFVDVLLGNESTFQIAAGAALGAVIGLMPKDNLIAMSLAVLLFSVRVNRSAGLFFIGLFSLVGPLCDGFTHKLGARLLSIESMQPTFAWLYDQPLGPWIGFNNTVVLGSFLLGIYVAYPVFLVVQMVVARCREPIAAWLRRYRIVRWLFGAEVTNKLGLSNLGLPGVGGSS